MSLNLDKSHSNVEFSVRHMGISTVRGRFEEFDVRAEVDENGTPTSVIAEIDAASITTGNDGRDEHLRSDDFFQADKNPKIRFESTSITPRGDSHLIEGNLTMRGVTKPVSFTAEFSDFIKDPWGNPRMAAEATGKINRTDWGLTWNQVLEAGSFMVSEDVRFHLAVEMVQQVEVPA